MSEAESDLQPVYLLADSQLLFWQPRGKPILADLLRQEDASEWSAAYIGVSNNDDPLFYEMFVAAMQLLGLRSLHHIKSGYSEEEQTFLKQANIILLSGGDHISGWNIMKKTEMSEAIVNAYYRGSVLIGVSAGAIQLGIGTQDRKMLQLLPLYLNPWVLMTGRYLLV